MMIRNIKKGKEAIKNSLNQEYDVPENLDQLNKWAIPKIEPKTIYKLGTFEKIGLTQVVKTTEESISIEDNQTTIKLLGTTDLKPYAKHHKFIHIGLVQIAFKPLTLEDLPESFIAVLRDGRNLNYNRSLMSVIRASVAKGPVYFDVYPNLQLSLTDKNILDALTLNIKTNNYNYKKDSEVMCVCYRIYYKPLFTLNPNCKRVDKPLNETILIETNFRKAKITTRRAIKWEEIELPDNWTIDNVIPSEPIIKTDLINLSQNIDGSVNLRFENQRKLSSSTRSFISPFDYQLDYPQTTPSRASTSQIREDFPEIEEEEERLVLNKRNMVKPINTITRCNINEEGITPSEMSFDF